MKAKNQRKILDGVGVGEDSDLRVWVKRKISKWGCQKAVIKTVPRRKNLDGCKILSFWRVKQASGQTPIFPENQLYGFRHHEFKQNLIERVFNEIQTLN